MSIFIIWRSAQLVLSSLSLFANLKGSNSAQVNAMVQNSPKKPDASAVANVLASRGITVTAASKQKNAEQSNQNSTQNQTQQKQPVNVSTLNLSSAISIVPASSQRKQQEQQQQGQFAVPQNKQVSKPVTNEVDRPPRPPTVDLTQDNTPLIRRGRPARLAY